MAQRGDDGKNQGEESFLQAKNCGPEKTFLYSSGNEWSLQIVDCVQLLQVVGCVQLLLNAHLLLWESWQVRVILPGITYLAVLRIVSTDPQCIYIVHPQKRAGLELCAAERFYTHLEERGCCIVFIKSKGIEGTFWLLSAFWYLKKKLLFIECLSGIWLSSIWQVP